MLAICWKIGKITINLKVFVKYSFKPKNTKHKDGEQNESGV